MVNVSEQEFLKLVHLQDESVDFIKWNSTRSPLIITIFGFLSILNIIGKGLFINFVRNKAPKTRPINTLILVEQVIFYYIYRVRTK